MSNDLTTHPIQYNDIKEEINSVLHGDYGDAARVITALERNLTGHGSIPSVITAAGAVMQNLDAAIDMLKQAEERIAGRRAALQSIRDAATDWALRVMQDADIKAIHKPGQPSIARHKNPPKVEILSEDDIPQLYRKMELVEKIDKKGIAAALKEGFVVPGAKLNQTEHLEIN